MESQATAKEGARRCFIRRSYGTAVRPTPGQSGKIGTRPLEVRKRFR